MSACCRPAEAEPLSAREASGASRSPGARGRRPPPTGRAGRRPHKGASGGRWARGLAGSGRHLGPRTPENTDGRLDLLHDSGP